MYELFVISFGSITQGTRLLAALPELPADHRTLSLIPSVDVASTSSLLHALDALRKSSVTAMVGLWPNSTEAFGLDITSFPARVAPLDDSAVAGAPYRYRRRAHQD